MMMMMMMKLFVFHRFFYDNPIQSVGRSAFQNLPELRTLWETHSTHSFYVHPQTETRSPSDSADSVISRRLIKSNADYTKNVNASSTRRCVCQRDANTNSLCVFSALWTEPQISPSFQIWQEPRAWRACKTHTHTHTHTHTQRNALCASVFAVVVDTSVCRC